MMSIDYPIWLRAAHFFNFLLLSLLVRSGLEILSAHPRLYWNDHCTLGSEWLKFTKKQQPKDRLWTASDEETSFPSAIALPGHENLGLGRHWHFLVDFAWLLTGLAYVVMLFFMPEWRRLIPTSWQIVPDAWHVMLSYLSFHVVETPGAYNALQRLSYAAVIFLLAPFSIATGIAMSPAIAAEVASHEGDARALHGHVRAGAHGNADFGFAEGRCVIDAVAGHRDMFTLRAQLLDIGDFSGGFDLWFGLIKAELPGHCGGGAAVVASEHDEL